MASELEKICVSLETAKKLHKAGIEIESCFYWVITHKEIKLEIPSRALITDVENGEYYCHDWKIYPAPTAEEIELPSYIRIDVDNGDGTKHVRFYNLEISKNDGFWNIQYFNRETLTLGIFDGDKRSERLCEVLSLIRFWLQEQGYLKGDHDG